MNDLKDYGVVMFGLNALQMPALISCAPRNSILSKLQVLGFPFNMSKQFLRDHVAFSPGNVLAGKYYTLFTPVYYHSEFDTLLRNMGVLAVCGWPVHKQYGKWHFLSIFTGGGFFGNFGMWLYYLMHRSRLSNGVLDLHQLPGLANSEILKKFKDQPLLVPFEDLNYWISCHSASAGVSAILSFGACCSAERIVRRLKECFDTTCDLADVIDFALYCDVINIIFSFNLFSDDVKAVIKSFVGECGLFDEILTKTESIIGYGGHLGGAFFGLAYYYFIHRKRKQ